MSTTTPLKESMIPQNLSTQFATIKWDLSPDDCIWFAKTAVAGITDCLNMFKNKQTPVVVLVQDLKGNRIIYACVQFIPADDSSEVSDGNWTYFWSFDCDSIPEDAVIYTVDQQNVQTIIRDRGYDLCKMTMHDLTYISQLAVYTFSALSTIGAIIWLQYDSGLTGHITKLLALKYNSISQRPANDGR